MKLGFALPIVGPAVSSAVGLMRRVGRSGAGWLGFEGLGTRAAKHGHTIEVMSRDTAKAQALADKIGSGATAGTPPQRGNRKLARAAVWPVADLSHIPAELHDEIRAEAGKPCCEAPRKSELTFRATGRNLRERKTRG